MRKINLLVIHCSASEWGDVNAIREWHLERGFSDIGYHYVILNGYRTYRPYKQNQIEFGKDGVIEQGRSIEQVGAHVEGHNQNSVGICLVGDHAFSKLQKATLKSLVADLRVRFPEAVIKGHYELNPNKTCPNMDMDKLRKFLV